MSLDKTEKEEVLGHAAKVVLTKDTTTLVSDGGTQESVNKRVAQIINLLEVHYFLVFYFILDLSFFCQTVYSYFVPMQTVV